MKERTKTLLIVPHVLLLAIALMCGCVEDAPPVEVPPPVVPPPNLPPSNLLAYSASASSIGLQWTISVSEADSTFEGYMIETRDTGGTILSNYVVSAGIASTVIGGLVSGRLYTFIIRSQMTGQGLSKDSVSIRWSPAYHLTSADTIGGPPIQLYESAAANRRSGLQFYDDSVGTSRIHVLGSENPRRRNADLYLSSTGGGGLSFASINLLGSDYPRVTVFSSVTSDASNLADPKAAPPSPSTYTLSSIAISTNLVAQSKIFYARSVTDDKYVRILVRRNDATGLLYHESPTGTNRYLILELSYQNVPGNQYARPGGGRRAAQE